MLVAECADGVRVIDGIAGTHVVVEGALHVHAAWRRAPWVVDDAAPQILPTRHLPHTRLMARVQRMLSSQCIAIDEATSTNIRRSSSSSSNSAQKCSEPYLRARSGPRLSGHSQTGSIGGPASLSACCCPAHATPASLSHSPLPMRHLHSTTLNAELCRAFSRSQGICEACQLYRLRCS